MSQVVRIHEYGSADVLRIDDIDVPAPAADEVQIRVKAIGLNRAEVMFRNGAYLRRRRSSPAGWATKRPAWSRRSAVR